MQLFTVPQLPLEGPRELVLKFPDGWDLEVCKMAGHDRRALPLEEIQGALHKPLGKPRLRELARGRKEVAIIVDDQARGMKWNLIAHAVLAELAAAGIPDGNIRFILSLGAHGPVGRTVMCQKLGEDIVSRYLVFNHNAFTLSEYVGTTKTWDVKISANAELMACDLKIALGALTPHPINGFGGGSKIVLPGVVSFDTIAEHHAKSFKIAFDAMYEAIANDTPAKVGLGAYNQDYHPAMAVQDEAAALIGLDFAINVTVNAWGRPVAMWAGDFRQVFAAALPEARECYLTKPAKDKDIVIANAFYKHMEWMIALTATPRSLKRTGGDLVLIANTPEGLVNHYYNGTWGKIAKTRIAQPFKVPDYVNRLIIYNEYHFPGSWWWVEPADRIINVSAWDQVLTLLQKTHSGKPSVALYPSADIQYMRPEGAHKHSEVGLHHGIAVR